MHHYTYLSVFCFSQVGLEGSVNPDHEKELKQEQETWEKKTGILTYLVDKEGEATVRLCTIRSASSFTNYIIVKSTSTDM